MIQCTGTDVLISGRAPLYDWCHIHLMITDTAGLRYYALSLGEKDMEGKAVALCSGNTANIIINKRYLSGRILAHEIVHVANWILEVSGVKTTQSNDEALAYLVDGITKWSIGQLCKINLKIK